MESGSAGVGVEPPSSAWKADATTALLPAQLFLGSLNKLTSGVRVFDLISSLLPRSLTFSGRPLAKGRHQFLINSENRVRIRIVFQLLHASFCQSCDQPLVHGRDHFLPAHRR